MIIERLGSTTTKKLRFETWAHFRTALRPLCTGDPWVRFDAFPRDVRLIRFISRFGIRTVSKGYRAEGFCWISWRGSVWMSHWFISAAKSDMVSKEAEEIRTKKRKLF